MPEPPTEQVTAAPGQFESTHWSVVLAAAESASPEAAEAMERLCCSYWYPLYVFLRRRGFDEQSARDATQEFFAQRIVTRKIFHRIDSTRGKFRSWLLASLQNFIANEHDWRNAQKRGGGITHLPLDLDTAEGRYRLEPAGGSSPEEVFEQVWALTLLIQVRERLQARYTQEGKGEWFSELKAFLPGEQGSANRAETQRRLGLNENALNVAIHRLRKEFGELVRAEIRRTVSTPAEVDGEVRYFIDVLSRT